ncbi:hypothetical protein GCM10008164_00710 [Achromobacter xylosoxidans]|nr:hypothetical protein GCM10008164_00710 [Achromobacter xylosoxidans]
MTIDIVAEEFRPAKLSVSWAGEAIEELQQLTAEFFNNDVSQVITEADPSAGGYLQKLQLVKPIPSRLHRKATEALLNLRHSFDQAMYAARNLTTGVDDAHIYFPWANGPKDLEGRLTKQKIDKRLWEVLAGHEPFGTSDTHIGGDDLIRTLAKLANDKHTVGLAVDAHIVQTRFPNIAGHKVEHLELLMPRWDPAKCEAVLMRWKGTVTIEGDYNVSFQIVFQSPRGPLGALSGLHHFAAKASAVIASLEAKCIELGR